MIDTKAFNTSAGFLFRVHLDETKTVQVPDPALPAPAEGEEDTRPLVDIPDPAWWFERTWGKEPPEGQTLNDYLSNCKREFELLAAEELAKRQPPEEIVLPI